MSLFPWPLDQSSGPNFQIFEHYRKSSNWEKAFLGLCKVYKMQTMKCNPPHSLLPEKGSIKIESGKWWFRNEQTLKTRAKNGKLFLYPVLHLFTIHLNYEMRERERERERECFKIKIKKLLASPRYKKYRHTSQSCDRRKIIKFWNWIVSSTASLPSWSITDTFYLCPSGSVTS